MAQQNKPVTGHLEVQALRALQSLAVAIKGGGESSFLDTAQLVATATFDDDSTENVTYAARWSSSHPQHVDVDRTGCCSTKSAGTARITAEYPS